MIQCVRVCARVRMWACACVSEKFTNNINSHAMHQFPHRVHHIWKKLYTHFFQQQKQLVTKGNRLFLFTVFGSLSAGHVLSGPTCLEGPCNCSDWVTFCPTTPPPLPTGGVLTRYTHTKCVSSLFFTQKVCNLSQILYINDIVITCNCK